MRCFSPARCVVFLLCVCAAASLAAQHAASAPRADGRITPLMVYEPSAKPAGCAPLALISHGAGGSERGYVYLARAMANSGFRAVVMGHAASGMSAARSYVRRGGLRNGIRNLVIDPTAETDRLRDATATLQWADAQCHAPFRVLMGHSMGAVTTMLEAGAKNILGITAPPAGADRFDAYVALSPEGPGVVFGEHGWSNIRKPMLIFTGTRDQSLKGGPEARQIPWHDLPGTKSGCQWMGVIDGATHMNFAGNGAGAESVERIVTSDTAAFLRGVRQGKCTLPEKDPAVVLQAK